MTRSRPRPMNFLAGAAVPLIAFATGCGGGDNNGSDTATAPPKTGAGHAAAVSRAKEGSLGKILVDSQGHTLYLFKKDRFMGDSKPGDTNGEGLTAFGGGWFALSTTGNQVSGQPSNTGGGSGY